MRVAVPEASRLWVDVLGAQPLEVSRSEGEALAAQTHRRMASMRRLDGARSAVGRRRRRGPPRVHWRATSARLLKVDAGDVTVLVPVEEALTGGACVARRRHGTPLTLDQGTPLRLVAPERACCSRVTWVDRLEMVTRRPPQSGRPAPHPGAAQSGSNLSPR